VEAGGGRVYDVGMAATVEAQVLKIHDDAADDPRADRLAVEAPLEVRFGGGAGAGGTGTLMMRTPGEDEDLVRGFLYGEGIIAGAGDVVGMSRPPAAAPDEEGNVIEVALAEGVAAVAPERFTYSSAACGVCGKTSLEALVVRGEPSRSTVRVARAVLHDLPARMRAAQRTFRDTGGLHASALFTPEGELLVLREDVGRHNALDKVVGWALAAGRLPLADLVLLLSGRISYELIQKAIAAGIPVVAAVGAPSSLAVTLAERYALTLVGFLRPSSMNVYAGAERVGDR